jgi:hypothetical protein
MSEAKFAFVPPTSPETSDELAHLRPEIVPGDVMYDMDPFTLFHEIGAGLIANEDITAEEVVVGMQMLSGRPLNTQGIRNLRAWAQEIIEYKSLSADPSWSSMNKSERTRLLFGVEIDFGEPVKEERIAG